MDVTVNGVPSIAFFADWLAQITTHGSIQGGNGSFPEIIINCRAADSLNDMLVEFSRSSAWGSRSGCSDTQLCVYGHLVDLAKLCWAWCTDLDQFIKLAHELLSSRRIRLRECSVRAGTTPSQTLDLVCEHGFKWGGFGAGHGNDVKYRFRIPS